MSSPTNLSSQPLAAASHSKILPQSSINVSRPELSTSLKTAATSCNKRVSKYCISSAKLPRDHSLTFVLELHSFQWKCMHIAQNILACVIQTLCWLSVAGYTRGQSLLQHVILIIQSEYLNSAIQPCNTLCYNGFFNTYARASNFFTIAFQPSDFIRAYLTSASTSAFFSSDLDAGTLVQSRT